MAERSSRRRLAAIVGLWTIVMVAVSFASGCYGHACDGDVQVHGRNPTEGRLLSADLWESSPIDGVWLDFPQQRQWIFEIGALGDREPQVITPYVSAQKNPTAEFGNFTIAGGNLAEISSVGKGRMVVRNGTCADYYLRVTVQAAPLPPSPPAPAPTPAPTPAPSPDAGGDAGAIP